ncbi:MAG: hypothetical protein JWM54_2159, partial [Acidobacteriaceae bacterium]|nr:hypothetical protein [Acidobacteriaceae bacterium]
MHVHTMFSMAHRVGRALRPMTRSSLCRLVLTSLTLVIAGQTSVLAQTAQDGQIVTNRLTLPRGGAWIPGSAPNSGHWWQADQNLGFCRLDPTPAGSSVPFQSSSVANTCSNTAKAGGQISIGNPVGINGLPANAKLIFVPDGSSKSVNVVRFVFNPATETITVLSTISVNNVTAVGGGAGGGRPLSAIIGPNGRDLYVGYKASGDIMMVPNATANQPGAAVRIGSTSDGKGIDALAFFNNDLYITEVGGPLLTYIPDPSGATGRPACNATSLCRAQTPPSPPPGLPSSPAALASDGSPGVPATYLYIGDAPLNGTSGQGIVRWNVSTG